MNFFSRQKQRTPAETVRALKENIVRLDTAGSGEGKKRVSTYDYHPAIQPSAGALAAVSAVMMVATHRG